MNIRKKFPAFSETKYERLLAWNNASNFHCSAAFTFIMLNSCTFSDSSPAAHLIFSACAAHTLFHCAALARDRKNKTSNIYAASHGARRGWMMMIPAGVRAAEWALDAYYYCWRVCVCYNVNNLREREPLNGSTHAHEHEREIRWRISSLIMLYLWGRAKFIKIYLMRLYFAEACKKATSVG